MWSLTTGEGQNITELWPDPQVSVVRGLREGLRNSTFAPSNPIVSHAAPTLSAASSA